MSVTYISLKNGISRTLEPTPKNYEGGKKLTLLPLQIILRYFGEAMAGLALSYKLNSSFCPFKYFCPKGRPSLYQIDCYIFI